MGIFRLGKSTHTDLRFPYQIDEHRRQFIIYIVDRITMQFKYQFNVFNRTEH